MLRMDLAHALDGVDAFPWSTSSHVYGSVEDIPDLLRALAGTDVDAASEALPELHGSVLHQGAPPRSEPRVAVRGDGGRNRRKFRTPVRIQLYCPLPDTG